MLYDFVCALHYIIFKAKRCHVTFFFKKLVYWQSLLTILLFINIHCFLLLCQHPSARVAPTKQLSIPRLELLAILIGTRRLNYVTEQFHLPVTDRILWTVSQSVFHWRKSRKPLPVFVKNRLKEIISHKDIKFRYVTTSQNSATRGVPTEELINNDLWWHGPSWLTDHPTKWPSWDFQQIDDSTLEQRAK